MKSKLFGFLFLASLAGFLITGCGETTYVSSSYFYPNWMPDGRVIATKMEETFKNSVWGKTSLGISFFVVAMSDEGSNESKLFEAPGIAQEITCSPTGEKIAYIYPDNIVVCDYQGKNKSTITSFSYPNDVRYLDWSPESSKLVFTTGQRKMYIINADGAGSHEVTTSAEVVVWRVGEKIVFEDSVYNKIWISNSDGSSKEVVVSTVSSKPQISSAGKIVFRGVGDKVKSINMDGTGEIELFSGYERESLKLSFDNTKITGGELITGGGSDIGGIWVTDISNGKSKRLR